MLLIRSNLANLTRREEEGEGVKKFIILEKAFDRGDEKKKIRQTTRLNRQE